MIWLLYLVSNYSVYEIAPDGASVKPTEETEVRLVSEVVEARVIEGKLMKFSARFTLENPAAKKITITIGFPFRNEWFDMATGEYGTAADRLSYRAWFGGKEIPAKLSVEPGSETAVYVSEITLGPHERKELACEYSLPWREERELLCFSYTLGYIATTGAAWAGKLDSAIFRFQVPDELPQEGLLDWRAVYPWYIRPPGYTLSGGWITWKFKDWEPSDDFRVSVVGLDWGDMPGQFPSEDLDVIATEFSQSPKSYELFWPSGSPSPRKAELLFLSAILERRRGKKPADTVLARVLSGYRPDTAAFPVSKKEIKALQYLKEELARIEKTEKTLKDKGFWELAPLFLLPWYYESGDITYYTRYGDEIPEDMLIRFEREKQRNYLRAVEGLLLAKKGKAPVDKEVRLFLEYVGGLPFDNSYGAMEFTETDGLNLDRIRKLLKK